MHELKDLILTVFEISWEQDLDSIEYPSRPTEGRQQNHSQFEWVGSLWGSDSTISKEWIAIGLLEKQLRHPVMASITLNDPRRIIPLPSFSWWRLESTSKDSIPTLRGCCIGVSSNLDCLSNIPASPNSRFVDIPSHTHRITGRMPQLRFAPLLNFVILADQQRGI